MAGDWIKMTHELPEKPEVLAISGKTGANRLEVVGRLFILWRWFDQHTIDGNALSVTRVTLSECLFGFSADTKFVDALIEVGWLAEHKDGISVVHFDAHISESAKQRALTAKRVAKSKGKSNGIGNGSSVTKVTAEALPSALPREDIEKNSKPPKSPKGDSVAVAFKTFITDCKAKGEKAIADYRPVFEFAERVGLPADFVQLAWFEFGRQFGEGGVKESKRQKDWRQTFRNYVEKNYLKLWWATPDGKHELTTLGRQAQLSNAERLAA